MAILRDTIQSIISILKTGCELLDRVSKPNPKHVKGPSQYEILKVRNKVIILIQLISLLLYTGDRVLNSTSVQGDLIRWCMSIMIILVLLLSCRYHHEIFNVFYTCMCLTYGPFIMNLGGESIHKAWMSALHLPMFAYLFTGSFGHFLFQITIQYYYVNNLYISIMEKAAIEMSPETFVSALAHSTNRNFSYAVAFGVLMNFILNKSFQRVICLEKRKTEFEAQKVFLLSFSHELRNLINSLTGNIKLASLVENISPRVKELLTNAEVCGEVLLHLVNNILDTGKVEIGELEVNPAPTRIYDTLEKTWGVCAELIKKQNIHGKMKIQKNIPKTLNIDHFRLTQMLLNLVSNSLKFTDHGSIEVSVSWIAAADQSLEKCFQPYPFNENDEQDEGLFEKQKSFSSLDDNILALNTSSSRIHINHFKQSSGVRNSKRGVLKVVVSDTGCGMDEEETTRLFKRFSQVSTDPGKRRLGTGLGLFITKQLCEKMGGEIKVFSKKNKGTSFIICIPVDVIPPEDIPESLWDLDLLRNFVMNQKLKAMLVDDISFNHTIMKSFFEKLGIEVVEIAFNGLEACNKYKEIIERGDKLDIVTMDLDMPIMDGKEATRKIREFELYKNLPPCFLTVISGNCSESEIEECLDRGGKIKADSFVKKPAALDELLRIIGHHFVRMQKKKHSTLEKTYCS